MKKEDIPQDPGALSKLTREVCYATDEKGNYVTVLSSGWEVKATALDAAWKDIDDRIKNVHAQVMNGEVSPIKLFMELRLMDPEILSAYTGFWKWRIRRHIRPEIFKKLSDKTLKKYCIAFNITLDQLKSASINV